MNNQETKIKIPFYVRYFLGVYATSVVVVFATMYAVFSLTDLDFYFEVFMALILIVVTAIFIVLKVNIFYGKQNKRAVDLIHDASPHEAIEIINQLLKYPAKSSPIHIVLTYNKALSIFYIGFPGDAIMCLKSCKLPKRKIFRFIYFHNISLFYFLLNEYEMAYENYLNAVSCSNKMKNDRAIKLLNDRNELLTQLNKTLSTNQNIEENYHFFHEKIEKSKNMIERLNNHYFFAKVAYNQGKNQEAHESLEFIINSNTNTIYSLLASELLDEIKEKTL